MTRVTGRSGEIRLMQCRLRGRISPPRGRSMRVLDRLAQIDRRICRDSGTWRWCAGQPRCPACRDLRDLAVRQRAFGVLAPTSCLMSARIAVAEHAPPVSVVTWLPKKYLSSKMPRGVNMNFCVVTRETVDSCSRGSRRSPAAPGAHRTSHARRNGAGDRRCTATPAGSCRSAAARS